MQKKLYKSATERKLCGVCGGLAEYLEIDVTVIRLIWVLLGLAGGFGLLPYLVAALIMPEEKVD